LEKRNQIYFQKKSEIKILKIKIKTIFFFRLYNFQNFISYFNLNNIKNYIQIFLKKKIPEFLFLVEKKFKKLF